MRTRKIQVPLRLNEKEFERLQKNVAKSCLNRERYLRALILGHKVYPEPTELYAQVVRLLSSASNNINQIARVANTTGNITQNDIDYLKIMAQKIWNAFKDKRDE